MILQKGKEDDGGTVQRRGREPDENGYVEDDYRIEYLREHIKAMKAAVEEDGVELLGYTSWGCIDLVSASTGEMKNAMDLFM